MGIATRMFAAEELEALRGLQGQAFLEQFYTCWTLREAYCKARGVGLAGSGKHFRFERDASGTWRLRCDDERSCDDHWQLAVEPVADTHVVAVAVNAAAAGIRLQEFAF